MILVVDNYDSFTYNLVHMLAVTGAEVVCLRNDAVDLATFERLNPDGLVISPGPSHPDSIPGVGDLVRHALGLSKTDAAVAPRCRVLGVCLGHQLLGRVFGARVDRAPDVVHGRATEITHDGRGIFNDLPTPLQVGRYHSLAVIESTLPAELHVTARESDGVIMAMRHASLPAEGVQFHPESILTTHGAEMLANFVDSCRAGHRPGGAAA